MNIKDILNSTAAASYAFGLLWAFLGYFEWLESPSFTYTTFTVYVINIPHMITTFVLDSLGIAGYLDSMGLILLVISIIIGIALLETMRRLFIYTMDNIILKG